MELETAKLQGNIMHQQPQWERQAVAFFLPWRSMSAKEVRLGRKISVAYPAVEAAYFVIFALFFFHSSICGSKNNGKLGEIGENV